MIKSDNSGGACGHDRLKLKAGSNYQPQSVKLICVPQIFLLRSDIAVNPRPGFLSFSSWLSKDLILDAVGEYNQLCMCRIAQVEMKRRL